MEVELVPVEDAQRIAKERGYLAVVDGMRLKFRIAGQAGVVGHAIIQDDHVYEAALNTACPDRHEMASPVATGLG